MHFHFPKPLHGWRAFAGEVGIIVVGVLIALGAEQVVQDFRERAELREAESAMRSELSDDDLQAYARAAVNDCFVAQLDGIENAVASGDRQKLLALTQDYGPVFRTWDQRAWDAVSTSQPFIQSGTGRVLGWAAAYSPLPVLMQEASEEQSELPLLRAKLSGSGALSPAQQDRLFQVIAVLRRHNARMTGGAVVFMHFAGDVGVTLAQQDKAQILAEARQKYGSCANAPAQAAAANFSSYYSSTRPRD